jgi:hypothetical protein
MQKQEAYTNYHYPQGPPYLEGEVIITCETPIKDNKY